MFGSGRLRNTAVLLTICLCMIILSCSGKKYVSPEALAKQADEAMAVGDMENAIRLYGEAINGDSSNFHFFWKRSIPFLHSGRNREALADLNRALSLDSKHTPALFRRAKTLLAVGKFEEAKTDLERLLKLNPDHQEALQLLPGVKTASHQYEEASDLIKQGQTEEGLTLLNTVLEKSPAFEKGLLMRARVHYKKKNIADVFQSLNVLLKASPTNTAALYLRGRALIYSNDQDTALTHFQQCLNYDAFDEDCKKALADLQQFRSNWQKATRALELSKFREATPLFLACLEYDKNWDVMMPQIYDKLTRCYLGTNDGPKALEMVDKMISYDDKVQEAFILKGEAYLLMEEWDKAIQEMQNALHLGQTNEARQGLHKAERAKKMALRKDYYKILDVSKSASKRDIAKAYRKLSMKYHPDKNTDTDSERMYRDVTEAYDVLNDDERRRKYDAGEDVNQPQGGQHQQGNPFSFFYGFQ